MTYEITLQICNKEMILVSRMCRAKQSSWKPNFKMHGMGIGCNMLYFPGVMWKIVVQGIKFTYKRRENAKTKLFTDKICLLDSIFDLLIFS